MCLWREKKRKDGSLMLMQGRVVSEREKEQSATCFVRGKRGLGGVGVGLPNGVGKVEVWERVVGMGMGIGGW